METVRAENPCDWTYTAQVPEFSCKNCGHPVGAHAGYTPRQEAVAEADRRAWEGPNPRAVAIMDRRHNTTGEEEITHGRLEKDVIPYQTLQTILDQTAAQTTLPGPEYRRKDLDPAQPRKARWDLLPALAEAEVVEVLTWSTEKYPEDNWRDIPLDRLLPLMYRAARSHMEARRRGEVKDSESKRHHLAHAILSLLFILEQDLARETSEARRLEILQAMEKGG